MFILTFKVIFLKKSRFFRKKKYYYMNFKIKSSFSPTGDQPEAILNLTKNMQEGVKNQTLLGVTGSGKTFTIANVIEKLQRPVLVLSHNKTLAAQLYSEFKTFFPNNAVEYFVSYYDYYQPEAYLPTTNTYIEKELLINDEIEKLRLSATSSLLSKRKDVIVISSVSCIYGMGNPKDFDENVIILKKGQIIARNFLLRKLVDALYSRNEIQLDRGNFRVKGDTIEIFLAHGDIAYRIMFWDDEIEEIESFNPVNHETLNSLDEVLIYPANLFVTTKEKLNKAVVHIQDDLFKQIQYFKNEGRLLEAKRIEEKVSFDLEMIKEVGYCSGIENYSRYFDGRNAGEKPFCLINYFPDDFITIIDESHVTIPQIKAMYGGDFSRKTNLVEHGFRLPSAIDNRPLKFKEFEQLNNQTIFVSATPADYELEKSQGLIIEQFVRPTGLLDPPIIVKPTMNQIDDLLDEIDQVIARKERALVITLTKKMAEELSEYLTKIQVTCRYIHSDVKTLDRVEIMEGLRNGDFNVLIGVNLLREGLDLPEVSLVAILDADKEGFLRSERSLTQTSGRTARNINGKVIFYADKMTNSMQKTIDASHYRRQKQADYNKENNIEPKQIIKEIKNKFKKNAKNEKINFSSDFDFSDENLQKLTPQELRNLKENIKKEMLRQSKELNFLEAGHLRDILFKIKKY